MISSLTCLIKSSCPPLKRPLSLILEVLASSQGLIPAPPTVYLPPPPLDPLHPSNPNCLACSKAMSSSSETNLNAIRKCILNIRLSHLTNRSAEKGCTELRTRVYQVYTEAGERGEGEGGRPREETVKLLRLSS